ncbi:hypothetical protein D1007_60861 [Hordeum vulgare]|nr:hypothetical protein D1007_60861 [Hordeum vulgare]
MTQVVPLLIEYRSNQAATARNHMPYVREITLVVMEGPVHVVEGPVHARIEPLARRPAQPVHQAIQLFRVDFSAMADSPSWKALDETYSKIASNCRNIRFGLSTDGFIFRSEIKLFLEVLESIMVPNGYCGNIFKCVKSAEGKISGLKTHDYHDENGLQEWENTSAYKNKDTSIHDENVQQEKENSSANKIAKVN